MYLMYSKMYLYLLIMIQTCRHNTSIVSLITFLLFDTVYMLLHINVGKKGIYSRDKGEEHVRRAKELPHSFCWVEH